jgi:hypothetical protein
VILITGLKPNTQYHGLIFALDDENSHGSLTYASLFAALHPLKFKFLTSGTTINNVWELPVINDGDNISEGKLTFQVFAKYKIVNQESIKKRRGSKTICHTVDHG